MSIREWSFLSLVWPRNVPLLALVGALSSGFLVAFFTSSQVALPMTLSAVLSFYFNLVFWCHVISLSWQSTNRRQPLDKSSEPALPFYADISLPRVVLLMAFNVVQQVLLIAALDRGWPDQFIPVTLGTPGPWGDFLRSTFAAFDTLATIGFGTLRPLKLVAVYLVLLNIYQVYFMELVLFGIVLTRTPPRFPWLVRLRTRGILASAGAWGKGVVATRLVLVALFFALGFIENEVVHWTLLGVYIPFLLHNWCVIAVYLYNAALRHRDAGNIFYVLALYVETLLTLAVGFALFTAVVGKEIVLLEKSVGWWLRSARSLAFVIDTLVGYGTFQFTPYGNWALVLTSMLTIQGFVMRVAVLADVFGRFFRVKR